MPAVLAVVPDTQVMTYRHPDSYRAIGRWLVGHAAEVDAVIHVGDVVHKGADDPGQFDLARTIHDPVVAAGLPLYVAAGNHDDDDQQQGALRSLRLFTEHVSSTRFADQAWFAGSYADDPSTNVYGLLDLPGLRLLVVVIEFAPRREVAQWATAVLAEHADRVGVLVTHSYLDDRGRFMAPGVRYLPPEYRSTVDDLNGEQLWQVLRSSPNLRLVLSGHQIPGTIGYRVDAADDGHGVLASFQNWQSEPDGGGGRIRLIHLDDAGARVRMEVVNTVTGRTEHDPGFDVELELDTAIGTVFPAE